MKNFESFTNLYPLSKTLRFELRPIGRTLENIQANGLLEQDNHRAESYKLVKAIIDRYHKVFIDEALSHCVLPVENSGNKNSLSEVYQYLTTKDHSEKETDDFNKTQDNLRKMIVSALKKDTHFGRIFKKELIREDLLNNDLQGFDLNEEEYDLIKEFRDFTTYFVGFNENRANMYSEEAKSTAIGYRLIHENLPKFIDNMVIFQKVKVSPVSEYFANIETEMEDMLQGIKVEDIFDLNFFNQVLVQRFIDLYNAVIGGQVASEEDHRKGLNQYINEYNQVQKDKKDRLPKFKPLFKQILSDRIHASWQIDNFESDNEVLKAIENAYETLDEEVISRKDSNLPLLFASISDFDLSGIYVSAKAITDFSQQIFKDWNAIDSALEAACRRSNQPKKKETEEKYAERIKKQRSHIDSYSVGEIIESLVAFQPNPEKSILDYLGGMGRREDKPSIIESIKSAYRDVEELLKTEYPANKNLALDKDNISKVKALLDAIKELQFFIKPLLGTGKESGKDERFYGEFVDYWQTLDIITPLYNKVRNYATRKPYSTAKFKLNFENSTLLNGWDVNKEPDNTSVLLRKDGLYYLAIMKKSCNRVFAVDQYDTVGDCYEKIDYKLLPGANKMLPKVFFAKSRIDEFAPSREVLDIYKRGSFKKGEEFCKADLHTLIDFYKASITKHEDWKKFGFEFSPTSSYDDISGFYREVEQQGYQIRFRKVSCTYIDSLVDQGQIYLFQIYNKDFSPFSKGTPNMHTLYWKMIFDERNLQDVVYKLNGQAEIFFRKSSLPVETPTHPANQPIANKNPLNRKKESLFTYDIVKNRRYRYDKFQFHVPITMNFKSIGSEYINDQVQDYIRQSKDLHFIGIDRGERHLLYLSVIDSKGIIEEQFSLNVINNEYNGTTYSTNYHDLLEERGDDRTKARREWLAIESIKELKEGYLSQVVKKITDLMIKYNAIVVLEDLNMGFKRGRQKVESSAYQQFEHKLIDKLNYLAGKTAPIDKVGGLLKAYQLATPYQNEMGFQNGFVFYIPAWNTSEIDPVTGFTNLFDLHIETMEQAKKFFSKFDYIRWNAANNWFEFAFDYKNFTEKADGSRTQWTLCTQGTRIRTFRNPEKNSEWDNVEVDLTDQFLSLFNSKNIDIKSDLKTQILAQNEKDFFMSLLLCLKLTLQMRNSISNSEVDYLISPVADANGDFFDSRKVDSSLPANADANGAYNIARKGLWMARRIKKSRPEDKVSLKITNKEWLNFAQNKPYLTD